MIKHRSDGNVFGEYVLIEDRTSADEMSSAASQLFCRAIDRIMYEQAARGHMVWVRNIEVHMEDMKLVSTMEIADTPGPTGFMKPSGEFTSFESVLLGERR